MITNNNETAYMEEVRALGVWCQENNLTLNVGLSSKSLTNFYRCTIESILSGCITAWYGNCTTLNRKALQRVVRSAHRITGGKLPTLQDPMSQEGQKDH